MNRDDSRETSDGELDRVIRDGLAIDTDPRRVARLEHFWRVQSRRRVWRRRALLIMPAAAAALVLVALLIFLKDGQDSSQNAKATRSPAPAGEDSIPVEEALVDDAAMGGDSYSAGRAPTDYERLVFIARISTSAPSTLLAAKIDGAISELALAGDSDAIQVLNATGVESSSAESILLRRLPRSAEVEQAAILRLLAVCGTPRSIPAIVRSARQGVNQEQVLTTIEQIVGVEGLAQVAGSTADNKMRTSVIERLLNFDSEAALLGYLSLVRAEATRPAALAAAGVSAELPISQLLAILDHKDKSVRLSAAMVLAHVNGPVVTQSLIERVTEKPSDAKEAWLALMTCRGQMAESFLAYASRRPQLLGHLNSARVQWALVIP